LSPVHLRRQAVRS